MAAASGSEEANGFRAAVDFHGGGGVRQQLAGDMNLVIILLKTVRTFTCMLRPVTSTVRTVRIINSYQLTTVIRTRYRRAEAKVQFRTFPWAVKR